MKLFSKRIQYTKVNRRGYEIVMPTDVYNSITNDGYTIGLVMKDDYKTVQLCDHGKYVCTLKNYMGAQGFKNGDSCDFHLSNLI